jgi:hypothetical protein
MLDKEAFLSVARDELQKHTFDTFVNNPPSVVLGGKGVVVPGCPACKKRLQTMNQFMDHLLEDVLPQIAIRLEEGGA